MSFFHPYSTFTPANGNITYKERVGDYAYNSTKPHAVTDILNPEGAVPTLTQDITYTPFNKTSTVTEGDYELEIVYGLENQRRQSILRENSQPERTVTYSGNYEIVEVNNETYEVHYITCGPGLVAINVRHNSQDELFYVYTDHLGSILTLTDESGNIVFEQNFDPWGVERNPDDWTYSPNPHTKPDWLLRGFTGHEHLPEFNLINMNGRVYDPVLGRVHSPDNFVQEPGFTQSYNRYSYTFNNPLGYTDPTGNITFNLEANNFWGHARNMAIGAMFGSASWSIILKGAQGKEYTVGEALGEYGINAVAALAGAGVGSGVNTAIAGGSFWAGFVGKSAVVSTGFAAGAVSGAAAGTTSGLITGTGHGVLEGQSFGEAFVQGGLRQAAIQGATGAVAGGILGGIDAASNDRNFWTGASERDVVYRIDEQGNLREISGKDFDGGRSAKAGNYRTRIEGNPKVTVVRNPDGTYTTTIKTPTHIKTTGVQAGPTDANVLNTTVSKGSISITSMDRISTVQIHGNQYHGTPVSGIGDLFFMRVK